MDAITESGSWGNSPEACFLRIFSRIFLHYLFDIDFLISDFYNIVGHESTRIEIKIKVSEIRYSMY